MNDSATPVRTKKQVILIKLKKLEEKLIPYCKSEKMVFPSIETIDLVDFLFYFNFLFPNESDYNATLRNLLISKDILLDENDLDKVIDMILPFITFLKNIK